MQKRREEATDGASFKTRARSLRAPLPAAAGGLPHTIQAAVWFAADPGLSGLLPCEGPTPAGLSLEQMSRIRAQFLADSAMGTYGDVLAELMRRDTMLAQCAAHEEVILWFEHDLYDQLQLIQILHWFSHHDRGKTALSLICIDTFPGIANFVGLGQLNAGQLGSLFEV